MMRDKFLDGFHATASQWMVLSSVTRAIYEHFHFEITKLPCVTFTEVETCSIPVNIGVPDSRHYRITRYVGKGYFLAKDMAAQVPLGISWQRMLDETLLGSLASPYTHTFFIALQFDGRLHYQRFTSCADGSLERIDFREDQIPVELRDLRSPRRDRTNTEPGIITTFRTNQKEALHELAEREGTTVTALVHEAVQQLLQKKHG